MTKETKKKALAYAVSALSRRRHTKFQLAQKLKSRDYDTDTIKIVLDYCEARAYLNDYEFACFWVEDRINLKPMGLWRLRQELKQKGINDNIADLVLGELFPPEKELELVKILLIQRLEKIQETPKRTDKLFAFLVRRGFSQEQIYKAAAELELSFSKYEQT